MVAGVEGTLSKRIPNHVAVIMDGNGRWAQRRALPQTVAHRRGAETLRRVVMASRDLGIRYLTAFAFSTENWRRPRQEVATLIVNGVRRLAEQVRRGALTPSNLDEDLFKEYLYTWDLTDPDLVMRTGREHRLSNFLSWQAAYSEFIFLDTPWPDFSPLDLDAAIAEFGRRQRRFGVSGGVEQAERTEPEMMDL